MYSLFRWGWNQNLWFRYKFDIDVQLRNALKKKIFMRSKNAEKEFSYYHIQFGILGYDRQICTIKVSVSELFFTSRREK